MATKFPFSAIVGQEKAKLSLMLNLINPKIGGVILVGEKGTAKSTLVRSIECITNDKKVINLPLNITEDRLVGGIDFEKAIKNGEKVFSDGLLKKADNNILYIDEVNLLSHHIVNVLMNVSSTKINIIEREGVSFSHKSDYILIGSMNPEEGQVKPAFIDKFGLFVNLVSEKDIEKREKIIKRRIEFEKTPKAFYNKFCKEDKLIKDKIEDAKNNFSSVLLSKYTLEFIGNIAIEANASGHRLEIVLAEASKAYAALYGHKEVYESDVKEVASLVLPHRMRELPEKIDRKDQQENNDSSEDDAQENYKKNEENNLTNVEQPKSKNSNNQEIHEQQENCGEQFDLSISEERTKFKYEGNGKRNKVLTNLKKGRYVKSVFPHGDLTDIAFDATVRASAIHQINNKGTLAIKINKSDLRVKEREKRVGATILFLVDASGSMGAKRRMRAVKGACLSLLQEAYQKRDEVGIVAFRKNSAEVVLPISRSVDLAKKKLEKIKTGGKTPLASGLKKARLLLEAVKIKKPNALTYLVLLTDGKANVAINSNDAVEDSIIEAHKLAYSNINCIVLDTENSYINFGFAKKLSDEMKANYEHISDIKIRDIIDTVKNQL